MHVAAHVFAIIIEPYGSKFGRLYTINYYHHDQKQSLLIGILLTSDMIPKVVQMKVRYNYVHALTPGCEFRITLCAMPYMEIWLL